LGDELQRCALQIGVIATYLTGENPFSLYNVLKDLDHTAASFSRSKSKLVRRNRFNLFDQTASNLLPSGAYFVDDCHNLPPVCFVTVVLIYPYYREVKIVPDGYRRPHSSIKRL